MNDVADTSNPQWFPSDYEAWYHTPRGKWIAAAEYSLMMDLMQPGPQAGILDVGCGTGYFSRCLASAGHAVTCLDPDEAMLGYAVEHRAGDMRFVRGDARALPFADNSFDHCIAVTSLCFVADPEGALAEIVRVAEKSVILGLLNRDSLLYRQKHGRGSYQGARWDRRSEVAEWASGTGCSVDFRSAIFLPKGNLLARLAEPLLPAVTPFGGFLAARFAKGEGR